MAVDVFTGSRTARDWSIGLERPTAKFFFTPAEVAQEISAVDAGVKVLSADVLNQASRLPPDFLTSWGAFVKEWEGFRKSVGWLRRHERGSYEKALEYRFRLAEWREAFEKKGGEPSGPALASAAPVNQSKPGEDLTSVLKWGAIAAGALGASYATYKLASKVRG